MTCYQMGDAAPTAGQAGMVPKVNRCLRTSYRPDRWASRPHVGLELLSRGPDLLQSVPGGVVDHLRRARVGLVRSGFQAPPEPDHRRLGLAQDVPSVVVQGQGKDVLGLRPRGPADVAGLLGKDPPQG